MGTGRRRTRLSKRSVKLSGTPGLSKPDPQHEHSRRPGLVGPREEPVKYHFIVHQEDGRFWAEVPALPGCFSMGDSREELLRNIKEAIACPLDPPTEATPLQG